LLNYRPKHAWCHINETECCSLWLVRGVYLLLYTISTRTPPTSSKEGEGLPDQCFYMAKGILVCPDFIYLRLVTHTPPPLFSPVSRSFPSLKGVFAKNERRYRLIKLVAIINKFNSISAYISPFIFCANIPFNSLKSPNRPTPPSPPFLSFIDPLKPCLVLVRTQIQLFLILKQEKLFVKKRHSPIISLNHLRLIFEPGTTTLARFAALHPKVWVLCLSNCSQKFDYFLLLLD